MAKNYFLCTVKFDFVVIKYLTTTMKPIINHFTDNDLYSFTCMYYILQKYPRAETEYCFFDRNRTCYPKGFDQLLREQLEHLAHVVITDEERDFMTRSFPFCHIGLSMYSCEVIDSIPMN